MTSKRQRRDTSEREPTDTPDTQEAAVAAIRQLMRQFSLDPAMFKLEDDVSEHGAGVTLSKVTYAAVAPLVGLDPLWSLKDIRTFEMHRSRIPTHLFKSIVMDMDIMLMQYGPPPEHLTEEARSRFFSPVFNHLVKQFTFMLRNNPETSIDGRIGYFFQTFGAVVILFIEMKLKVGNDAERLKAIAQVIAECDSCDLDNSFHKFALPIHCVFTDGWTFEFFKFERNPNASFIRGCFPGDPKHLRRGLGVPDFTAMKTCLPFILQLRCACEIIFDLMLSAYIAGLKAYYNRSQEKGKKQGSTSLDGWDRALQSAECALAAFREAEGQREGGDLNFADATVDRALLALQDSTGAVSTDYTSDLIIKDWDDFEVRKG